MDKEQLIDNPPDQTGCADLPLQPLQTEEDKQGKLMTEALEHATNYYKKKNEENPKYKKSFIRMAKFILLAMTCSFIVALFFSLFLEVDTQVVLAVMGGGAATTIIALFKIPEIIAKYLFPLEEDKTILELIKTLKDK
ncbi:MAG: hypothetical protein FWD06_08850 [Oscillospiraceae bacterium]|nr:hypothetical protein [Oscillospiraceae bacterium]